MFSPRQLWPRPPVCYSRQPRRTLVRLIL